MVKPVPALGRTRVASSSPPVNGECARVHTYGDVIKEAARSSRRDVKGQPVMIEPQAAITCTGDSLSPNTIYRMYRKTVTTVLRLLSVCSKKRNSQILVMFNKKTSTVV